MIKPITKNAITALPISPPSGTKNIVWDVQVPGFGAYKVTSGRVSFIYQYRMPHGPTRSMRIGCLGEMTIDEARAAAGDFAQQRRRGTDPIAAIRAARAEEENRESLVIANYVAEYLLRRDAEGKSYTKGQEAVFTRDIAGLLGDVRIDRLTLRQIEEFAAELGTRGPSARRMGIVYIKVMLNDAVRRAIIPSSPAIAIRTPKSGERDRRLRNDELQRFLEAANDVGGPRGDIYEALVRLLKRKEEVSDMRWEDLDLARGTWNLAADDTKNRQAAEIVLPRQVKAIIERQQPDPALRRGPVFTLNGGRTSPEMGSQVKDLLDGNMHRRLELANKRDGTALTVAHFTIHDLRTTGASQMQDPPLSVPPNVIDAILLHVSGGKVTRIYQRSKLVLPAGVALQKWNDWVDKLMMRADSWPGGNRLPTLTAAEIDDRLKSFRNDWPERADQKRARLKREAAEATRWNRKNDDE